MEGLGAEVSAKIRSAIKAKLIELEAYVDDELPDYIMVMVANKRTKEQMEDDLGLFLNNNTGAFTHWLHAVLEKLQKVTLGEVAKSKKEAARKKKKITKESSSSKRLKDAKDSQKREREKKSSSSVARREEGSRSRSSKKPREEGKSEAAVIPKGIPKTQKGTANPNVEALGKRQPKKTASPAGSALGSGGKDGYDPGSLLKNAVAKTKDVSKPKLTAKKPASPVTRKVASPSLKKASNSSKKSPTKKSSTKKDSSRKSKSSKKSAAEIFKEDGDDVQLNLSHEDKSDPMFANLEDKAESESGEKKKIINLKEDSEFHRAKPDDKKNLDFEIKKRGEREKAEKAKSKKSSRSRSRSMESRRQKEETRSKSRESRKRRESAEGRNQIGKVRAPISHSKTRSRSRSHERSGLASTVVKPTRHDSDNEYDPEKILKRSLASKAMIPPRPVRPTGREEQGSARAISRAVAAADRSIMTSKRRADSPPPRGKRPYMDSPPRGRRDRSPRGRREESPPRRFGARSRDYDARPIANRRKDDRGDRRRDVPRLSPDDIEKYKAMKEQYALKRRGDTSSERRRLNDGGKRGRREFPERRLAMDDEMEKRGRRSSLDRKLEGKREGRKEDRRPMDNKEDDDIRIIVRRDISPESPPKRRREEGKRQEELRRRREQERRLDEDDDELLEMRKKALESLMRRRSREDVAPGERKIIIPLDDESSSDSDTSTSSKESEVSLSDVEELQAKSRELERRVRNRQGRGRDPEPIGRHRQDQKREVREEEGSDNEREPTFTVTLDGIDEKYFKKCGPLNAPLPLIRPSPEKNEEEAQNESFERDEESDQELVLHPNEEFDEPEPENEEISVKKKEPKDEKVAVKEKESKEKEVTASKPVKSVKPALSTSTSKTTKPVAPVTGRKRSPIRPPTEQAKAAPAKKVAAVKPSVAAVIKPIPSVKAVKPVASEQKQKIKRTPITAPPPDPEPAKSALPALPTFSRTISNPSFTRTISAPVYNTGPTALQTKSGETCKFWPRCVRGDACLFYHPPVPSSAEVILSNKYKWTAT